MFNKEYNNKSLPPASPNISLDAQQYQYGYASDAIQHSPYWHPIKKACKMLNIGRNTLYAGLRELGILGSSPYYNKPCDKAIENSLLRYYSSLHSNTIKHTPTHVSRDGISYLMGLIEQNPGLFPLK